MLLVNCSVSFSQQTPSSSTTQISLVAANAQESTIKFKPGQIQQTSVPTGKGDAVIISIEKGTPLLEAGSPDLPKLTSSVIVPDNEHMDVNVIDSKYTDYLNIDVAPSKGSILRTTDPDGIVYTYGETYRQNKFFPEKIASLRDPYIMRDYRAQTVVVFPVQYNPVTKTLRIYSEITVKVSPSISGTSINILKQPQTTEIDRHFDRIYRDHFLNFKIAARTTLPAKDFGSMLIICYGPFINAMQPFIQWKKQEGIQTDIVDVASIGNDPVLIKSYIVNYYNTHSLTYLLLVGDNAEVSSSKTNAGASDNEYGYILGDDHYQEIFIGRFSAEKEQQVITQVERTLSYEKNPLPDNYYSVGAGIASDAYTLGDDYEHDWQHEQNIRTQLLGFTYSNVYELYDGNQGGNDAAGDPSSSDLAAIVNSGAGLINYTGHGNATSLGTTNFDGADAEALNNTSQWPFIWVVGCQTGNFTSTTCLAESWARATYNGLPSGAVASFMSTVDQYWSEPMEAQDQFNNLLTDSNTDIQSSTFGYLSINGCFSMNDKYGVTGFEMTDTWTLFGDPSLAVRTAFPSIISVYHDSVMYTGDTTFIISCDDENAIASFNLGDSLIGKAEVENGMALITFPVLQQPDTITLTVTSFNKTPYNARVPVLYSNDPNVSGTEVIINDIIGNHNGLAESEETISVGVTLKNAGLSVASGVSTILNSTSSAVTIIDSSQFFGVIADTSAVTEAGAFTFIVDDSVAAGELIPFTVTISDSDHHIWTYSFSILLYAPKLEVYSLIVKDSFPGNGDHYLDAGETDVLSIVIQNMGNGSAGNLTVSLSCNIAAITLEDSLYYISVIAAGTSASALFNVSMPFGNVLAGTEVFFTCTVTAGAYYATTTFPIIVTPQIDNFETGDLSLFQWINDGKKPWFLTSESPYEGIYCIRSGKTGDNESSSLQITLDVSRNDSISFYRKVSSEANVNYLKFFIDDIFEGGWSGITPWTRESYPVITGTHTFKWTYIRDGSLAIGEDCAWLDLIDFPPSGLFSGIHANSNSDLSFTSYPNPFADNTIVSYELKKSVNVTLRTLDVSGNVMQKLIQDQYQPAGIYHFALDGSVYPNGIYFCQLSTEGKSFIRKLIINH
ncbi:MAG: T9SS type A sorting domain-containing protein [Chitinophagales bacterium]|nr:T9SS type A sorting domain-containing protein [Chitinophagales bacterium]